MKHVMHIDPTIAGDHSFGHSPGAMKVLGSYTVGQAIARSIHEIDRFLFHLEAHYIGDGTKNFFPSANITRRTNEERSAWYLMVCAALGTSLPIA